MVTTLYTLELKLVGIFIVIFILIFYTSSTSDKQHELSLEGKEPQKQREVAKKCQIVPRNNSIMSKIVTQREVSIPAVFKDEELPVAGVLTDHQVDLTKVTPCQLLSEFLAFSFRL